MPARTPLAAAALVVASALLATPVAADPPGPASLASFEGGTLDLAQGWGEAQACLSDGTSTRCYRTEGELLAATAPGARAAGACSAPLALYDGAAFAPPVLYLDTPRGTWINLSSFGFADVASSFTIGACDTRLAEHFNGLGAWYPVAGSAAWSVAPTLSTFWDDQISSLHIL